MKARRFAVFDIDGTLIRWQLYHAIADALVQLEYVDADAYQAVKNARMVWKRRAEADAFHVYEQQLVKAYENVLTKLSFSQFETAADMVFEEYKDQVYTFTRDLIGQLKAQDYLLFAISGSQMEIVQKVASYYGFDDCVGSLYERSANGFTGKVTTHRTSKDRILAQLTKKHGATYKASIAVGDSESDISLLEAVEQPIAFNPTKQLFAHARQQGWKVVIERKNVIYTLKMDHDTYVLT